MEKKRKNFILLIGLMLLLFILNYSFLDNALVRFLNSGNVGIVGRVIDGDTIVVGNKSIRFLGINCPEKGEKYYQEAKDFVNGLLLNKTVELEGTKNDRYYRELRYILINGMNVNVKLVEQGLANVYILDDKNHETELRNAWEKCIETGKNLCEKSDDKCSECIELSKLDCKTQEVIFENKCDFDCNLKDWSVKDEGRKKFIFDDFILKGNQKVDLIVGQGKDDKENIFWERGDYVWTSTGDTLFLRDSEGKLVLWEGINY